MVGALDECFDHVDVPGTARPVKGSATQFVLQVHVGTLTHQQFDNGQTVPIFENKQVKLRLRCRAAGRPA